MVVGEPSLMGGEFGEEDERLITRLENSQYDPSVSSQGPLPLHGPPVSSSSGVVGGCGLSEGFPSGPPGGWGPPGPPLPPTSSQSSGPPSSTSSSSQPPMDKSESTKKSPKNR